MVFSYHGGRRWQYHYRGKRTADDQCKVDELKELGLERRSTQKSGRPWSGRDGDFAESSWCDAMEWEIRLQNA